MTWRPLSALIGGLPFRLILAHMASRRWGKWLLAATLAAIVLGPVAGIQIYREQGAAIALATAPGSGGSVLIPAQCDVLGAELGKDYVVAFGKVLRGSSRRSACFYSVSAFRRLFPERYKNDDPSTFRVQQLTTGMRLLAPSAYYPTAGLVISILAPILLLAFGMVKSVIELFRSGTLHDSA